MNSSTGVFNLRPMDESEFIRLADAVLQDLDLRIPALGIDADR